MLPGLFPSEVTFKATLKWNVERLTEPHNGKIPYITNMKKTITSQKHHSGLDINEK